MKRILATLIILAWPFALGWIIYSISGWKALGMVLVIGTGTAGLVMVTIWALAELSEKP